MELPVQYIDHMKELLGEEYPLYEASLKEEHFSGLRVNTKKISVEDFLKISPFSLTPVPWIENGFYVAKKDTPSKHPYYYAGLYYLQEPSAMTPANFLPVESGDKILDLCGAPGGKATELGARLSGSGFLLANDLSNSRAKAMLKNLELFGISNLFVSSEAPEKLFERYEGFFDKILVDAPCSGEGMFRKDPSLVKSWIANGPEYYAPIQKQILDSAVSMLKPGGVLLYSTCTFSEQEDEEVILTTLEQHPEMKLIPFEKNVPGFSEGRRGLTECIRIFPHKVMGEGHFLALLQKSDTFEEKIPFREDKAAACKLPEDAKQFLKQISREFPLKQLIVLDDSLYALPEGIVPKRGIRYLRTGLLLGTLKKERFEPSQALAMALKPEEFSCTLNLKCEDERVIRYLKGETISLLTDEVNEKKGYCLVAVDGFSLGFAKINGASLKNKYQPGWRMM